MGIKKLFTFLNNNLFYKTYPFMKDLIYDLKLKKSEVIVGIDGNLYTYKYTHSYDNMLIGFYNQIINFLSSGIIPFYIFDGGTINEKENTIQLRNLKRIINKNKLEIIEELDNLEKNNYDENSINKYKKNSIKITKEEINKLLELLDLLNIPYIFAHGEGEYLSVLLNKLGIIDFILTDDTDPIAAGAEKIIKFYNNNIYYLDTAKIFVSLDLTFQEFSDFCILLGNDYINLNHNNTKPDDLYKIIKKYSSIENIIESKIFPNISIEKIELINKIREIYKNSSENERLMFINPDYKINNLYQFIDHSDYNNYSNIILEFWDEFLNILTINNPTNIENKQLKIKINNYIRTKKFNIKNIINFLKNHILDISQNEIYNMQTTFEYLNTFGF